MNSVTTIILKDIVSEFRTKDILFSMAAFSIVVVVLFSFSLEVTNENAAFLVPSLLWVSTIFVGTLGLSRSFAMEKENGAIIGVLLSPIDRSSLYFAKVLSNFIYIFIIQLLFTLLFILLFNINIKGSLLDLLLVFVLGGMGFSSLGTLFSTMAINTRLREIILPVILFPLLLPVLVNAIRATSVILAGGAFSEVLNFLKILISFDIIFLAASSLVYEYVVEES